MSDSKGILRVNNPSSIINDTKITIAVHEAIVMTLEVSQLLYIFSVVLAYDFGHFYSTRYFIYSVAMETQMETCHRTNPC